ncbi:NAD(P)/FAD-dependent oxidoreductase, partial [Pseudomonas coronafaciens]
MSTLIETDAIVIGGGIVGASAALTLALKGKRVALLERDFCGSHSSGVNYGGVRRQGRPLSQLPLSQRAHQIWGNLRELIGIDGEYQRSGHLKLARSEQDMNALRAYAEASQGFGLDLQLLDRDQLRARYPWAGDVAVGASLCADDGHANPRLVSPAFARAARRAGAQVFEQAPVSEVSHDGNVFVVTTASGL